MPTAYKMPEPEHDNNHDQQLKSELEASRKTLTRLKNERAVLDRRIAAYEAMVQQLETEAVPPETQTRRYYGMEVGQAIVNCLANNGPLTEERIIRELIAGGLEVKVRGADYSRKVTEGDIKKAVSSLIQYEHIEVVPGSSPVKYREVKK